MNDKRILASPQLYLGPNRWGGYDIICNSADDNLGDGICKFHVTDELISEGREMQMGFDSSFVKINIVSYHHVMNIFNIAGEKMCEIGYRNGSRLERDVEKGDYLYCLGDFIHIKDKSDLTKKCWEESFYYDGINLQLNLNKEEIPVNWEEFIENHDLENDLGDLFRIPKDTFIRALNIAKSAILECKDYLKDLYETKKAENKLSPMCLHKHLNDQEEYLTRLGYISLRKDNSYFIVCDFMNEPYDLLTEGQIYEKDGLKGYVKDGEILCPPIFDQIINLPKKREIYLIKGNMYTLFTSSGYNLMNGDINEELKNVLRNGE